MSKTNIDKLKIKIQSIVTSANELKNKHINDHDARVNYSCIFSQSKEEYEYLNQLATEIGKVIKDTPTGPLYQIAPLPTVAGNLQLLKIRIPDPTRPELGDADFTINDFLGFEKEYLQKPGFKRIQKEDFYMIELVDHDFNVRAYFSNPPLDEQLGLSDK